MTTLGFIGTGNMAGAIARGVAAKNAATAITDAAADTTSDPIEIVLFNPTMAKAESLARDIGAEVLDSPQAVIERSDVVVLGFKPGTFPAALPTLAPALAAKKPVVVSIAAGLSLARLAELLSGAAATMAIARVMPNVNALVGASMSAVATNEVTSNEQLALIMDIFSSVGEVIELDEAHFSAFTAIAGSSPAFTFLYIDALARGAVQAGLPKPAATRIAAQAVLGSAKLLLETGEHPWSLIDTVSSPGGTTVAGLVALEDRAFLATVIDGVRATIARDQELGAS